MPSRISWPPAPQVDAWGSLPSHTPNHRAPPFLDSTSSLQGISLAEQHFTGPLLRKWTLGVPFYGRHTKTGEARTFYDMAKAIKNNRSNNGPGGQYYNSQVGMGRRCGCGK